MKKATQKKSLTSANTSIYKIYDRSKNELTDWTVTGLENAYYYTINNGGLKRVGGKIFYINPNAVEGTNDKFYVYDNTYKLQTGKYWGYYGINCGCTTNIIGSGKTNTEIILTKGIPIDYTPNIWEWIRDCRNNSINGCNDWYIGSTVEIELLRLSGLVNWFDLNNIWSAVEYNNTSNNIALFWLYKRGYWDNYAKGNKCCCFCMRSF